MYSYKTAIIASLISLNLIAMNSQEIITGASYAAPANQDEIFGWCTSDDTPFTLYTFDGTPLKTMPAEANHKHISGFREEDYLDKSAPKPQPTSCAIKYWPACTIPMGGILGLLGFKARKGMPGHFIIFYDKNDKIIRSYRYDTKTDEITVFHSDSSTQKYQAQTIDQLRTLKDFPLDLSKVILKNNNN